MTKKDLFRIIIKITGLYIVLGALTVIPQIIFSMISSFTIDAFFSLTPLLILIIIIYYLLFKTDLIISWLRLEKGFDEEEIRTSQFNTTTIIQVGIVIISLYFMLNSIPEVATNLFYAFKNSIPQNSLERLIGEVDVTYADYKVLTSSSIQLALSFLLLTNKKWIAEKINNLK